MDRRIAPRIPLDTPCLLTLLVNYEEKHVAMVVDVSPGGVQLALSSTPALTELAPGMPATLQDVPFPFDDLLEGTHGKIAWVGIHCCGVRFNKELRANPLEITDLARL